MRSLGVAQKRRKAAAGQLVQTKPPGSKRACGGVESPVLANGTSGQPMGDQWATNGRAANAPNLQEDAGTEKSLQQEAKYRGNDGGW